MSWIAMCISVSVPGKDRRTPERKETLSGFRRIEEGRRIRDAIAQITERGCPVKKCGSACN